MKSIKLFLLLVLTILWFGLVNLSSNLLGKTPLYSPPLEISHTWATRKLGSIRDADLDKENVIKFPITVSSITLNIIAELNRSPKGEEEEKEVAGAVFWECSKGLNRRKMVGEMLRPAGHERTISVNKGGFTSSGVITRIILISIATLFAVALYFSIISKIIKRYNFSRGR